MLERIRNTLSRGISILAQRVSSEPRYPNPHRVPSSQRTTAGVLITPDTAVTISAVWACLRYLSQTVAVLPWRVMEKVDAGAEIQDKNPIDYLLRDRPNPEWSSFQFRETLTHWALRWGNGYAEIERDTNRRPIALWPVHPERVTVCRDPETRRLYYEINNGSEEKSEIDAADMFHIRGFGEGIVGVNAIHYAAQSLGWAKAAQTYGAAFFGNGAVPTVVVKNKKGMSPAGLKVQREEFDDLHKGPGRAHRSAHLDMDAEVDIISFDAQQTQIVEVHQFLVEEICRWFGVPPHKVMHLERATFSNIEHQAIEVVVDSITPWMKRFEDEANFKLFGQNRRGLYTKMNEKALLRGDMKARMEYLKGRLQMGSISPNEIREIEDENSIGADGDIYVMQEQMVPLEFIAKRTDPNAEMAQSSASPEDDSSPEDLSEATRILNMDPAHV